MAPTTADAELTEPPNVRAAPGYQPTLVAERAELAEAMDAY
jgi:hypothetical protein